MRFSSVPLCCCEYVNENGQRSHILTCCCDCQAFDEICERLITCRSIDVTLTQRVKTTILDRCRFPFPGGAKLINFDLVLALLLPPFSLIFATIHFLSTFISIVTFISFLLIYSQSRCDLHISFVISYMVTEVLIFAIESQPHLDILFHEGIIIYSLLITSVVCLTIAKYHKCPVGKQTPLYHLSWINSPVYNHNFKWLLIGSCIVIGLAFYIAYLTVVTQCQLSNSWQPLDIECPEIYHSFRYAISFQCGLFALTGGLLLCFSVLNLFFKWPNQKSAILSVV